MLTLQAAIYTNLKYSHKGERRPDLANPKQRNLNADLMDRVEKDDRNSPCADRPCRVPRKQPRPANAGPPVDVAVGDDSESALLTAAYRFLTIANNLADEDDTLGEFVDAIKTVSGCTAVGIRILDDHKCLIYGAHCGFGKDFMAREGNLSLENSQCLCTRVFLQQTDTAFPFFTSHGSFFTNHADTLLSNPEHADLGPVRGTCFEMGYQSMGLFPIRSMNTVLGIIHVADHRPGRLSRGLVQLLEKAALQLGISIEKARALKALKKSNQDLESRVKQRTAALKETIDTLNHQIEQRILAEKDLKDNQQLLQRIFESISDPLILMDEKAHVTMVNQAAMDYYGIDLIEKASPQICFEGLGRFRTQCQSCRIPTAVTEGRQMEFEREGFRDPDRTEAVELFPIKDTAGKPRGAVMRIHDVTGVKDAQQQIIQLQNQASIGMLVSSVAHEIKNPNSFIAFNISVLKTYFSDLLPVLDGYAAETPEFEVSHMPYPEFRKDVFKLMDTIEHGSKRIDSFLGNLKTLGPGKPDVKCIKLSLQDVISKVLDTVRSKIEKTVRCFEVLIDDPLPDIYSDPGILEQVLLNLLVNAAQAADKGDAHIYLKAKTQESDGAWVTLMVEDNGHGMDPRTQRRIFEPFYSTKIAEGGTGLGLYVCRNLLNEIGGRLYVESELGKGSRFTIELPAHTPAAGTTGKNVNGRGTETPPVLDA